MLCYGTRVSGWDNEEEAKMKRSGAWWVIPR
ncbi:Protein of unknown function [Pyronema omphalodes CBS 100304]|uniref:Uncharacterized protein n=1 Tax=Pyronema omphalodes (strain CBS 100304) TaxID=1076935 RepID=U4LV13_PYROM|nr:Protein of unknown function [Pyronema omphalodes CBS 100304]